MSLRPSKKSDSFTRVSATSQEIFFISNGIRKRKIYYNVDYTEAEAKWIQEVRRALRAHRNIEIKEDQVILRYYYSADLALDKCLERLLKYHEWHHNPEIQTVTDNTTHIFKEGFIYSHGKARDGRPVVIMNLGVFNLEKHTLTNYFQAMNHVLNQVLREEFVHGLIESYYFVLDLDEKLLSLPLSSLGDIIKVIANAYSMCLQKMMVVNCTTLSKWIYNRLTGFISQETVRKITLYTKDDILAGQLKAFIDADELERKYGGERPNRNHVQQFKNKEKLRFQDELTETQYFSIEENESFFNQHAAACCINEQCEIF